jgi:uncharacterized protein (DUF488 family)
MLLRQRTILSVLDAAGGAVGQLDLFKLLFLAREENELPAGAGHDFLPYKRGPYSFTLARDVRTLKASGLVRETKNSIEITAAGAKNAGKTPSSVSSLISATVKRHQARDTSKLIDHVYATYPWYTVNSKWEDRRAQERPTAEIAVYTTSYEGVQVDGLLNRLMHKGIDVLIDVRYNPVARRYGFHKSTLASLCNLVGIDYIHRPEVGIPGDWRADLGTSETYESLFKRYASDVLPAQEKSLIWLAETIKLKPTALMCKEADPKCCHRTTLAKTLADRTGLPVLDIGDEEVLGGLF